MKKVLIVELKSFKKDGIRPEYTFLDETDFTDEKKKELLKDNNLILIRKMRERKYDI